MSFSRIQVLGPDLKTCTIVYGFPLTLVQLRRVPIGPEVRGSWESPQMGSKEGTCDCEGCMVNFCVIFMPSSVST